MRRRWSLVLAAGIALSPGCEAPSARVDGKDLKGVFDRDAGPAASTSAASASSAGPAGSAAPSARPAPPPPRPAEGDGCVEATGAPRTEVARTVGRPACRGAEILEWRDAGGAPRYACLFAAPGDARPLPLVVFLHGDGPSLDTPAAVHKQTGLRALSASFPLSGPDGPPGFHVVAIQGRLFPGRPTAGFDVEHAGPDNRDLATVEHFLGRLVDRGLVDRRRVYAVGLGPGGQLAATWAMIGASRVAAFAAFGAPPPVVRWTCPGPPPPGAVAYRACDAIVPCESVESWLGERAAARAETLGLRLGDDAREELLCEPRNRCGEKRGTAAHARWPKALEKRLLGFLAERSLAR